MPANWQMAIEIMSFDTFFILLPARLGKKTAWMYLFYPNRQPNARIFLKTSQLIKNNRFTVIEL